MKDFWDEVTTSLADRNFYQHTEVKRTSKLEINDDLKAAGELSDDGSLIDEFQDVDAVILTALNEPEFKAVQRHFKTIKEDYRHGFIFHFSRITVKKQSIKIALARQQSMGMVSAAILASVSLICFKPKIIAMCGICAGVKGQVNLGDIIVSSPTFDYGAGKRVVDGFLADYRQCGLINRVRLITESMADDVELLRNIRDQWEHDIGKPITELRVHIKPTGSGAAVVTDPSIIKEIKLHQRGLAGIDMEAFGVAEASNELGTTVVPWIVAKGVQDFANPSKNDNYREYSAEVSASFIFEFLKRYFA